MGVPPIAAELKIAHVIVVMKNDARHAAAHRNEFARLTPLSAA
jgi:hypothetical protein